MNADAIAGTTGELLSCNMFAYSKNNPINLSDPSGYLADFCYDDGNRADGTVGDFIEGVAATTIGTLTILELAGYVSAGIAYYFGGHSDEEVDNVNRNINGGNGSKFEGPDLKIDDNQFGRKVGKHAEDYGLNAKDSNSRQWVRSHIEDIVGNPSEVREGTWRGLGDKLSNGNRADGLARFYRQGNDVVVTDMGSNFVTILKDGATNNTRFQGATVVWTK